MKLDKIYLFDGSLEGLLTAIFEWFERKPGKVSIQIEEIFQPDAFTESFKILTDREKADRVWKGLQRQLGPVWLRRLYCAYLSEKPEIIQSFFDFAIYIFQNEKGCENNFGHPQVLAISQIAIKVEREKHRMEAFIRFQRTADDIFYCAIEPDFNVIPLIAKHFKERYADQRWIIYDIKRGYGIYYDLKEVEEISLAAAPKKLVNPEQSQLDQNEQLYATLWKDYFKSTNIVARKNTKLHVQHVPKRYWRYLTEKFD